MPTKSSLKKVALYGGAISSVVPDDFIDLSDVREVPDTQEVYVTTLENSDDSIVFDLLEQVKKDSWQQVFEFHIAEVCRFNNVGDDEYQTLGFSQLGDHRYASLTTSVARKWGRDAQQNIKPVLILVNGLIQLENVATDVLVSYNLPIEEESQAARFHDILERIESVKEAGRHVAVGEWKSLYEGRDLDNSNEQNEAVIAAHIDSAISRVSQALTEFTVNDWNLFKSS